MPKNDNFNNIYMSIRGRLARAVSYIVPPREIEDIVQETYVKVCQVGKEGSITHPRSFLLKTARNLALDYVKRAEYRLTVSAEEDEELDLTDIDRSADETFDQVAANEEFAHFCEAVRQLPVQCRRAFVLKKVYGYSQREIARDLNISESTVEKHIATGIKRCTYFMMLRSEQGDPVGQDQKVLRKLLASEPGGGS